MEISPGNEIDSMHAGGLFMLFFSVSFFVSLFLFFDKKIPENISGTHNLSLKQLVTRSGLTFCYS